jgi:hypothetical protein
MQCACAVLFHLWSAHLYNIFPHNITNGKLLEKVTEQKMHVLIFLQFTSETFFNLRGADCDIIKSVYRSSLKKAGKTRGG